MDRILGKYIFAHTTPQIILTGHKPIAYPSAMAALQSLSTAMSMPPTMLPDVRFFRDTSVILGADVKQAWSIGMAEAGKVLLVCIDKLFYLYTQVDPAITYPDTDIGDVFDEQYLVWEDFLE